MDENHANDQQKRQGEDKRSAIIERIRREIETKKGVSVEELKRSYESEALFYRVCLIFTTATNKALCVATGIPLANGRMYSEALLAERVIWRVEYVHCPFNVGKDWTLTANPRTASTARRSISPLQPQ